MKDLLADMETFTEIMAITRRLRKTVHCPCKAHCALPGIGKLLSGVSEQAGCVAAVAGDLIFLSGNLLII